MDRGSSPGPPALPAGPGLVVLCPRGYSGLRARVRTRPPECGALAFLIPVWCTLPRWTLAPTMPASRARCPSPGRRGALAGGLTAGRRRTCSAARSHSVCGARPGRAYARRRLAADPSHRGSPGGLCRAHLWPAPSPGRPPHCRGRPALPRPLDPPYTDRQRRGCGRAIDRVAAGGRGAHSAAVRQRTHRKYRGMDRGLDRL